MSILLNCMYIVNQCQSSVIVCSNCNLLRSRKARHRVAQSGTQKWRGQVQPIGYRCYSPKPGAPRLSRVCKPQGWTCWEAHHAVEKALWGASEGLDSHKKNQKTQALRGKIIYDHIRYEVLSLYWGSLGSRPSAVSVVSNSIYIFQKSSETQ